ncbi:hypothetical protein [Bifidobacterium platyrrhinorum]|uniref:Uncharacterized protein n=1 Tax=Bifidobacterium platyrrhinorum TaxID=2661628 RepID=A0A6L9SSA6_9BIFI|nr:hypothetical protein [Bifidobacterium platyrrhinorum]NEG55404.1 hypothetical protein [Bifidobacterium platyrrhinorum]
MNVRTYGRHCSGYQHPDLPLWARYERETSALLVASMIVGFAWLVTHDALYHPIGNVIAAFMLAAPPLIFASVITEGEDQ